MDLQILTKLEFTRLLAETIGWLSIASTGILSIWMVYVDTKTRIVDWFNSRKLHMISLDGKEGG